MAKKGNYGKNGSNDQVRCFENNCVNRTENQEERYSVQNEKEENNYSYYFDSKKNNNIVLYDEFPDIGQIYDYYKSSNFRCLHPLVEYGNFEIKELAEIIKFIYSIKCQYDYQIITTGGLIENVSVLLDGEVRDIMPNLYFFIGSDKNLEFGLQYGNLFLEDGSKIVVPTYAISSMIVLSPNRSIIRDKLGIKASCFCDDKLQEGITYYNYFKEEFENAKYLSTINIFESNFLKIISGYSGIQDTLSFLIHSEDVFVAKILLSIVIYKKNNDKIKLSNDDYSYIFRKLFNENVNIKKSIDKNIPKRLKYVPRSGYKM